MRKRALLFLVSLIIISCNEPAGTQSNGEQKHFPKPGTVVAKDEIPVTSDPLNHFVFSVKVIADSNVANGVYDIDADYGPNYAAGQLVLPEGCKDAKPVIRKGSQPYTFIIGFRLPHDTTFYDYMEVSSSKNQTKMQYIKAYSF